MSIKFEDLVGPSLLDTKSDYVPTRKVLQGKKYVMLYFSAHWCGPCCKFTPFLAAAYKSHEETIKISPEKGDEEIEVIFVSLDTVKKEFDSYRSEMPWLSIPYENLWKMKLKDQLSKKYGVSSIPTLIVLDGKTGDVVMKNGKKHYDNYFKGEYDVPSTCVIS